MKIFEIVWIALTRFNKDDGAAIASHLALSILLALFPFLLIVSAIVSLWGDQALVQQVLSFIFENWPADTAAPIQNQITIVLSQQNVSVFSITGIVAIILASNGVEAARTGLNRAYEVSEGRSFLWRRLQSILFVIIGATALILVALILIAAPITWRWLLSRLEWLEPFSVTFGLLHYLIPMVILLLGISVFHIILPAGKRSLRMMTVGILFTLFGIVVGSKLFAVYLTNIASYSALYAGLAGVMSAIIYLYYISVLFLLGAELNAAIGKVHRA